MCMKKDLLSRHSWHNRWRLGRLGVVLKKLQVRDMVEQVLGKARTPPVARGAVGAHARHGPGGADPNHRRELCGVCTVA